MYKIDALKILVAEDNPINQKIMETMIRMRHWDCKIVSNGMEAVEATRKEKYDLIFMDLNMPVLDGLKASKIIRQYDKTTPIIAITAYTDCCYREMTEEIGMNDFIPKPFTRMDIYNAVMRSCLKAV